MAGPCFQYWKESEMIHIGAEARVTSGLWLGIPAVLKSRRRRGYRHMELDARLTKSRITVEAKVLSRLQITQFSAPRLLQINHEEGWMVLSKLGGNPIYESLVGDSIGEDYMFKIGEKIRELHELGLSHGDLTTHNIMIDGTGKISLLDFGLSRISAELEHMGQDLQVLNECLSASHSELEKGIEDVLIGYSESSSTESPYSPESVISRFNQIRNRVRYMG
ncbi:MAG TPA: Kae1-associated serine/threonine protein kinase [Candidatus Thalassarchaeaceae archaeon]|jgi:TP53 regulating kinase-like protein|nr:Kae1-associated kinase Bud32 [Euryarchaeota archaeon]DAC43057.1 MAG TPA: Kae1-associated serine/threonine protein kinase [Candidatus Poseidoniales archaeon]HII35218.1 Kae1-associated serine/threonine protein kinase [Candidatus Thalassarchaeaceae archaeon]|tara:strand:- start:3511 stop:4173 length:663 start_codon:yes stop_codon:yes gene_type:complete